LVDEKDKIKYCRSCRQILLKSNYLVVVCQWKKL
jgi:hypothetical protein